MKVGWQIKELGNVCSFENGDRGTNYPSRSVRTSHGIPFINAGHLTESGIDIANLDFIPRERFNLLSNGKIRRGDILFCLRGSLGKFASVGNLSEGAVASSLVIVRPKESVLSDFVLAYFQSNLCSDMIDRFKNGAAQPNLSAHNLAKFTIPLPPLPEQRRIVGVLAEAFGGISTAKVNAEQNLQNARALFESHLQAVFIQHGEGWVEERLGDVCTLRSGTTVSAVLEKPAGDLPYLKVADMTHAGNEFEIVGSSRFLNMADIGRNAVLPSGTTIFPKRGGAILTNKKRLTAVPICADLNIMGVIPGKRLLPKYVYFYFLNVDMRRLGSGSSIPQINNYDIEPLVIPFPQSARRQAEIVGKLEELSEEAQRLSSIYQQKLAALDDLKKSLLHQAFNGQL